MARKKIELNDNNLAIAYYLFSSHSQNEDEHSIGACRLTFYFQKGSRSENLLKRSLLEQT